jgi:uncharacterized membrane protein HdeD (DUF308 family)
MTHHLKQNWWLWTIRGIILIVLGLIAVAIPGLVWSVFIIFFGILAAISGIFLIIEGIKIKNDSDKALRIIEGIFYLLLGLFVIFYPGISLAIFIIILGFWAIFIGGFQIATAVKLRKIMTNEWLLFLNGGIAIIFGLLLISDVVAGAEALMILLGIFAIVSGFLSIVFSFMAKRFVIE